MFLKMIKQKGFTIIELIVVIAIIAVLASIVMINVMQYISKSKDTAIKANLDTIRKNAAVWYDNHGSYSGFDTDASSVASENAITKSGGILSYSSVVGQSYCYAYFLPSDPLGLTPLCVDYNGYFDDGGCGFAIDGGNPDGGVASCGAL